VKVQNMTDAAEYPSSDGKKMKASTETVVLAISTTLLNFSYLFFIKLMPFIR
jgi:hypothetical protein